jgi:putative hemolysin
MREQFGAACACGQCAPRLCSGASARPLNFAVRGHVCGYTTFIPLALEAFMTRFAAAILVASLVATASADTPKPTQAEARAKIEAHVLALAQAKCAKNGKVALAQHREQCGLVQMRFGR